MAVSGVGGTGTSIYGSRNVLSGLASGMDTESMIENMTKATRLKIAQQKQKKTLLGWKQQAYQGISTQLIDFSKKYMDFQSPTNLLSSGFFDQSITTSVGKNSGLVSATGNTKSNIEINGVKQTADRASHIVQGKLSAKSLESKEFNIAGDIEHSKLAGQTLTFEFGTEKYTITLRPEASLNNVTDVVNEINHQLGETKINGGTLKDKIKVSLDGTGNKIKFESTDQAGNNVKLVDASKGAKDVLKLSEDQLKNGIDLKSGFSTEEIAKKDLVATQKNMDSLVGKTLTLSFNGQKKEITLLTDKEKEEISQAGNADQQNKKFIQLLQGKLDTAFGAGNITLEQNPAADGKGGKITFKVAGDDPNDPTKSTNVLKVVGASDGILGTDGLFGFKTGDGNRLNMETSLKDLGIKFDPKDPAPKESKPKDLVINGVTIGSFDEDSTIGDVIRAINSNEEAGVNASYSEATNQFILTTKETGENSKIDINGGLAEELFGRVDGNQVHGKDAIVDVTVNGVQKQFKRASNEIDIDGLKVTVSGTFGDYTTDPNKITVKPDETVTFTSKPDTEKVFDAIKEMVDDYNKIVDSVYKEMTTKPNRDYQPLTEEQKKEMSKEQIEKWEEKAKEGLLFADTELRSLHDSLRFIFNPGGEAGKALRAMGIEPTTEYKDGGKIKLDENKLKEALASNPEKVKNAFNALASDQPNPDAGIMNSASKGGALRQMKAVTDRFASTSLVTPGSLVARAGSPSSPNSMMKNTLQKEIDGVDKYLNDLDKLLKKEVDRYNSKFTQLEKLIAQMNAQSGQLAGLMGGGM